jgi:protein-S-isoprenylcysteine O-methyltransferase Ste14
VQLTLAVAGAAIPPVDRGLLLGTAVVWAAMELRQSINHRPEAVTADKGSRPFLRIATAIGVVGAILFSREVPSAMIRPTAIAAWIGLVILWCGIALRFWSFRTLGRYFTFTVQTSSDQPIITDGPYRVIRHPSYAGVLLAVIGLGLYIGNWLSLLILTLAVTCGLVFRIKVEERALLGDVGDAYRTYAATHKRLVPFIW